MLVVLVAGLVTGGSTAATREAGAAAHASFLVTLSGTISARSDSSVGQENGFSLNVSRRSIRYHWMETLRETVGPTGSVVSLAFGVRGAGSFRIYLHMRHANYKDIEAGCTMQLAPARQGVADRLSIAPDASAGGARAGGLLPVDLLRASYRGPVSIGGFAAPCFDASPYDWAGTLGLPIRAKPKAPPFERLSCYLTAASASCSKPFFLHRNWRIRNGSASLTVSATLRAKRLELPQKR